MAYPIARADEVTPALRPSTAPTIPSAQTTGPRVAPGTLVDSIGTLTIRVPGEIIENRRVFGSIVVATTDVHVRNCMIDAAGQRYGVQVVPGASAVIEDVEIRSAKSAAIYGGDLTARRVHAHHLGSDAFKLTRDAVVEGCYVHHIGDVAMVPDPHADAVQVTHGGRLVFRGNRFDLSRADGFRPNVAFMIQTNFGPIDDVLIEGNWLDGGGFTIQVRDKRTGHGVPTGVVVRNNHFGGSFGYGLLRADGPVTWVDNRWADNGTLARPDARRDRRTKPATTGKPTTAPVSPTNQGTVEVR